MYDYMTYRKALAILRNLDLIHLNAKDSSTTAKYSLETFENDDNNTCVTAYEIDENHFPFCLIWASLKFDKEEDSIDFFFKMNEDTCEVGSETGAMATEKSADWKAMITLFCKNISERI